MADQPKQSIDERVKGRRSKLNPTLREAICDYIEAGNYVETACAAAGITDASYYGWMRKGQDVQTRIAAELGAEEDVAAEWGDDDYLEALERLPGLTEHEYQCFQFFRAAKKATARAEAYAVMIVRKHMPDQWTAAMTYLERRFPGKWKRRDLHEVAAQAGEAEQQREREMLDNPEAVELMHKALEAGARGEVIEEAVVVPAEVDPPTG